MAKGPDWSAVFHALQSEAPGRLRTLTTSGRLNFGQGEDLLGHFPGPFRSIRLDGNNIVDAFAKSVEDAATNLGEEAVIVGVLKKGLSLLTEVVSRRPTLSEWEILSSGAVAQAVLQGRRVLVVDDSIHSGATLKRVSTAIRSRRAVTVVWATLLSTDAGLKDSSQYCDGILPTIPVPLAVFDAAFQRVVVPALYACSKGAIADRPCSDIKVSPPADTTGEEAFTHLVRAFRDCRFTRVLQVTSTFDVTTPLFKATIELTPEGLQEATQELRAAGAADGAIRLAKARVFFAPLSEFHVRIYGIAQPESTLKVAELEKAMDRVSGWVVRQIVTDVTAQLSRLGYTVVPETAITPANAPEQG
jgi:hypothetical protein